MNQYKFLTAFFGLLLVLALFYISQRPEPSSSSSVESRRAPENKFLTNIPSNPQARSADSTNTRTTPATQASQDTSDTDKLEEEEENRKIELLREEEQQRLDKELNEKLEELKRKEQDLKDREADLKKRERELKQRKKDLEATSPIAFTNKPATSSLSPTQEREDSLEAQEDSREKTSLKNLEEEKEDGNKRDSEELEEDEEAKTEIKTERAEEETKAEEEKEAEEEEEEEEEEEAKVQATDGIAEEQESLNKNGKKRKEWPANVVLKPELRICGPITKPTFSEEEEAHMVSYMGCFRHSDSDFPVTGKTPEIISANPPLECMASCTKEGYEYSGLTDEGKRCICGNNFGSEGYLAADQCTLASQSCGRPEEIPNTAGLDSIGDKLACGGKTTVAVYRAGAWPPPYHPPAKTALPSWFGKPDQNGAEPTYNTTVTVYLWANPRLASIWRTCRLTNFSRNFDYKIVDLRHQIRTVEQFNEVILKKDLGFKIIVYDGCCTPGWVLLNWPPNTVLVVSGDESARWGFAHPNKRQYWGPHGPGRELPSDENNVIIIPAPVKPWFKQYYSERHVATFGDAVRYLPLGSRTEFPDPMKTLKPSSARKYLFSFMGAPTDPSRKRLRDTMKNDTLIPKERSFLHIADHWSADPNAVDNNYVAPQEYEKIMTDSVFTPCPKGNSVEQFRLYEAIESGSIPVIEKNGDYARERLPPSYMESPFVFVETWDDLPKTLIELEKDMVALNKRQVELMKWYHGFLRNKIDEIETILLSRVQNA